MKNNRTWLVGILLSIFLLVDFLVSWDSAEARIEWNRYLLEHGNVSVILPEQPRPLKTQTIKTAKGDADIFSYQACLLDCAIAYTVDFVDHGEGARFQENTELTLDFMRDGALKKANGHLLFESMVSYEGHPGREIRIGFETHQGQYVVMQRMYLVGNRVYTVGVSTPARFQSKPEHMTFLDSFQIVANSSKYRVYLSVEADDVEIRNRVHNYLSKGLRSIPDVDVGAGGADWVILVVALETHSKSDDTPGFMLSTRILRPWEKTYLGEVLLDSDSKQKLRQHLAGESGSLVSYEGGFLYASGPDELEGVCKTIATDFNNKHLELARKKVQVEPREAEGR